MLGHQNIAVDAEIMFLTRPLENVFDDGAGGVVCKVRISPMATEGDEVVVFSLLVPLQAARHGGSVSGSRCRAKTHS